jgi:hypothetical protein
MKMMIKRVLTMIWLSWLCFIAAPAEAASPSFEVRTAGDQVLVGPIQRLAADGSLTMADQAVVAPGDLVSLRRLTELRPAWPRGAQAILHNGDRLAGAPLTLTDAVLQFRAEAIAAAGPEAAETGIRLPLTAIAFIWLRSPEAIDRERFASFFAAARADDQVMLRNGDLVAGTLTSLDGKQGELQIDGGAGRRTIALARVTGIALSTKLARARKPTGPFSHLVFADGSRITATTVTFQEDALEGATIFRQRFRALTDLVALDVYQGKAVYLSDLKPAKYEYRTYEGEEFSWAADRNLEGGPLQLKGRLGTQTFDKGVAVHGECTIAYALDGAYRRFESLVGLDAQLGARGSADVHVLVDGQERKIGDGKPLTLASGPLHVRVDVKGAKALTFVVKWGEGGNVGDHVDWCEARLIR